jgi:cell division septation protein DedD
MEKKQVPGQLELFSSSVESQDNSKARTTPWQSLIHLNIEQAIMISVIVLMVVVFSFSLGVEKGKRASKVLGNKDTLASEAQQVNEPVVKEVKQEAPKQEVLQKIGQQEKEIKQKTEDITKYTIQVASFKKRSSVDEEARGLQKKGYETVILPKGNYIILCVGKYQNKEEARISLGELRKKYKDCLIREL